MVDKERNDMSLLLYEILDGEGYSLSPDYLEFKKSLVTSNASFIITGHEQEDIGGTFLVSLLRLPSGR